ncbi:MAG: hypothetical protein HY308_05720 [Gammaproteobacteria bacterium]|nr:hypothetical protein [Gammaproteobacteria bacterium]
MTYAVKPKQRAARMPRALLTSTAFTFATLACATALADFPIATVYGTGSSLNVRASAYNSATPGTTDIIGQLYDGDNVLIYCQTEGRWIYGAWGWTNIWDHMSYAIYDASSGMWAGVQAPADRGGWNNGDVTDGYIYTGSNGFVAGHC